MYIDKHTRPHLRLCLWMYEGGGGSPFVYLNYYDYENFPSLKLGNENQFLVKKNVLPLKFVRGGGGRNRPPGKFEKSAKKKNRLANTD